MTKGNDNPKNSRPNVGVPPVRDGRNIPGGPQQSGSVVRMKMPDTARVQAGAAAVDNQTSTRKRTILIVAAVIVAALAIWLVVWLFACSGSGLFDANAQTGQAPYKTDAEMQAELDRVIEEGMFNISIASVIEFENADADGTAYIENVPNNNYNMKVAITEDDTGDVLYESGVLAPNQYIEKIALAKQLEAGSYPCTATFTALDPSTYEETGQAAARITINVLN